MFFNISQWEQTNFSCFYHFGPFSISTDEGWRVADFSDYQCLYKGYADSDRLSSLLDQIVGHQIPELLGNFCVIVFDKIDGSITIKSDLYRSFPIWFDSDGVSNLSTKANTAWTDSVLKIRPDFSFEEIKFDVIGKIDTTPVTVDQVIDFVDQRLNKKTQQFLNHNQLPIRAFLSGGVDTALVYSYLQQHTKDFELLKYNIIEYDSFWLKNSYDIKNKFWGYTQIHHWTEPCLLTSGAPGDEFMLRSPSTVDMFLKYHGIHVTELLQQKTWLHSTYFSKTNHLDIFKFQVVDQSIDREKFYWHLCNVVVNDWQHWHLGHTLTWTPLRDLEIFKMFLRLPAEQALGQIMNSDISCALIEKNCPGLSRVISDQKNSGNAMKNLIDFFQWHKKHA